jgi:hypothetical protein
MPGPEPSQPHFAAVGNDVASDELLVPDPGPRANRGLDAAKPSAEELLDGGALVTEDLAVPVRLERTGEILGHPGPVLPYRNLRRRLPPCQPRSIVAVQRPSGRR